MFNWKLKGLPTYLGFQALFRVVAPRRGLLRIKPRYLVSSPINHSPLVPWAKGFTHKAVSLSLLSFVEDGLTFLYRCLTL